MNEPQAVNVSWVYAESNCTLVDLQELAERELILLQETEIFRDPLQHIDIASLQNPTPLDLTPDQQKVWEEVQAAFLAQTSGETLSPFLLHGVTGSGKTEIYLRAAAEAVRRGRQALILVPEICADFRRWYAVSWRASPGRWDSSTANFLMVSATIPGDGRATGSSRSSSARGLHCSPRCRMPA